MTNIHSTTMRVGFIGVGAMGGYMASLLISKLSDDSRMFVYDVVPSLTENVIYESRGKAIACKSPVHVAQSSVGHGTTTSQS